jgi:hypothetical protein
MNAIELARCHRISPAARWIIKASHRDTNFRVVTEPLDDVSASCVVALFLRNGLTVEQLDAANKSLQADLATLVANGLLQAGILRICGPACGCGRCQQDPGQSASDSQGEVILIAMSPPAKTIAAPAPDPVIGGFPLLDQEPPESWQNPVPAADEQIVSIENPVSQPLSSQLTGPAALHRLWQALIALGQVLLLALVPALTSCATDPGDAP